MLPFFRSTCPSYSGSKAGDLALPGNVQAFTDTPIYSRTNGYLKKWYFDIGAHVHKGDLLAEIETPEIDQQLEPVARRVGAHAGQRRSCRRDQQPVAGLAGQACRLAAGG